MKSQGIVYEQRELKGGEGSEAGLLDGALAWLRILLVLVCVYATASCFTSGMDVSIRWGVWFVLVGGLSVLFYAVHRMAERFAWSVWASVPLLLLGYFLTAYHYRYDILQGFYYVAKNFVRFVKTYYKASLLQPRVFIDELELLHGEDYYVTFFLVMASVAVLAVVSAVYYKGRNAWLYLLHTAPFVVLPLALGRIPDGASFISYVGATLVVLGSLRGRRRSKDSQVQGRVMLVMALFFLAVVGLVHAAYPRETYGETMNLEQAKKDLRIKANEVSRMRVFKDMTLEQWVNYNFSRGIDFGKLGGKEEVSFSYQTVLELSMNSHNLGDDSNYLYLKGFVGGTYQGDHWEPLATEGPTASGTGETNGEDVDKLFLGFVKSSGGMQLGAHWGFGIRKAMGEEWIHVKNVAAGKGRAFIPYFMEGSYTLDEKGRIRLEGEEAEYDVVYRPHVMPMLKQGIMGGYVEGADPFLQNMAFARENSWDKDRELFDEMDKANQEVREKYLAVPDDVKVIGADNVLNLLANRLDVDLERGYRYYYAREHGTPPDEGLVVEEYREDGVVKKAVIVPEGGWNEDLRGYVGKVARADVGKVIDMVQQYVWKGTRYTLSPGSTPADKDFVDYFMLENKKGYCVHYATTATLLFRALGIPARMVEGYVVSPDGMKEAKGKANVQNAEDAFVVNVKDNNAHAWVEAYVDNVGWIPVEVTPSSGLSAAPTPSPTPTAEVLVDDDALREEMQRRYPAPTPLPERKEGVSRSEFLRYAEPYGNVLRILDALLEELALPRVSYLLLALAAAFVISSAIRIRRRLYQAYRLKVLPKKGAHKRVAFLYRRLNRAFRHYGVVYERQSVDRYERDILGRFAFLGLVDAKSCFLEVVFKNSFAKQSVSEEECEAFAEFYDIFCNRLYENVKLHERWYIRNILCL